MAQGKYHHSDELLDELDSAMLMLGRLMTSRHAELCDESRLDGPRLMMLRLLAALGPQKAGELAHNLGIKAPATTALIDSLENEGLVVREHSAEDRRVILVEATQQGLDELTRAEASRRERMRSHLSVLSEEDVRAMIRIQRTLIAAMVEHEG